jgi:transposase
MDDFTLETALDTRTGAGPEPVRRVEVLGALAGRRRSWSLEQKLAIVAEAEGCDNLTALARRHDIRTSQLYTWRRELRYAVEAARTAPAAPMFVPLLAEADGYPSRGLNDVAIEVEIDGAVARISRTAEAGVVTAVVRALRMRR